MGPLPLSFNENVKKLELEAIWKNKHRSRKPMQKYLECKSNESSMFSWFHS